MLGAAVGDLVSQDQAEPTAVKRQRCRLKLPLRSNPPTLPVTPSPTPGRRWVQRCKATLNH
jgi:hypothetical protein